VGILAERTNQRAYGIYEAPTHYNWKNLQFPGDKHQYKLVKVEEELAKQSKPSLKLAMKTAESIAQHNYADVSKIKQRRTRFVKEY